MFLPPPEGCRTTVDLNRRHLIAGEEEQIDRIGPGLRSSEKKRIFRRKSGLAREDPEEAVLADEFNRLSGTGACRESGGEKHGQYRCAAEYQMSDRRTHTMMVRPKPRAAAGASGSDPSVCRRCNR